MSKEDQFSKQKYLNIETYRKNGEGVRTPVWFVQDGGFLYVITSATSGKAKRIRNNGKVNVAPCKMDGRLVGEWLPAQARELADAEGNLRVNQLFDKKYGLLKKIFGLQRTGQAAENIMLEIKLTGK